MKRSSLGSVLFALVTGCVSKPPRPLPGDANAGCGTYLSAPSDAACSTLCSDHGCPTGFCSNAPDDAGVYLLQCNQDHTGRRPPGLVRARAAAGCAAGRFFALAAHLEAASVPAFVTLARELARLGAPRELCRRAERSACEEQRHARVMARYARRHGVAVPAVVQRPTRPRSLEAVARDNAVEGCVRETFGAALALHQSLHAGDRDVRAAMAAVARDEVRHAELARDIDAWARTRLPRAAAVRVARARAAAAGALRQRELASTDSHYTTGTLGLPPRERRLALVDWIAA